jgi:phage terminase small subunit
MPNKAPTAKPGTSREAAAARKKIFAEAYIANGGNGTQAAITAGYSPKSAAVQAVDLLKDPNVSELISHRAMETAKKYELTTDLVIKSIVQELMFDPASLYNKDGTLKDITELDEDTRMALASIDFEQVGGKDSPVDVRKVKWASRHQAREQAMKHLGMFEVDNKQKAEVSVESESLVELARKVAFTVALGLKSAQNQ